MFSGEIKRDIRDISVPIPWEGIKNIEIRRPDFLNIMFYIIGLASYSVLKEPVSETGNNNCAFGKYFIETGEYIS
jgi:hypothetical protein